MRTSLFQMSIIFRAIGSASISFLRRFRRISRCCLDSVGFGSLEGGLEPNASATDGDGDFDRLRNVGVLRLRGPLVPLVRFELSPESDLHRVGVESLWSRPKSVDTRRACESELVDVAKRSRPRVLGFCRDMLWSLGADAPVRLPVASATFSSFANLPLGLALPNATGCRAGERPSLCTMSRAL